MPVLDTNALIEDRVHAIREYHEKHGIERAELDLSGGLDSAVLLGLLARALGPENITTVYSSINSSLESLMRARLVAETFGVRLIEVELSGIYEILVNTMLESLALAGFDEEDTDFLIESDPTVLGSLRSCLRAPIGRGYNRLTNGGIRHGTGNECEDRIVRFYQKGGDGEVDTNPCAMLTKGEMYQLALALGVPREIITAKPTPDLWASGENHNDEDEYSEWLAYKPPEGMAWYSYINPDTGVYLNVGLIERTARFVDLPIDTVAFMLDGVSPANVFDEILVGEFLFDNERLDIHPKILKMAETCGIFAGMNEIEIEGLLRAMKRAERITRHKMNPNIPSLGSREALVEKGILTNTLPV